MEKVVPDTSIIVDGKLTDLVSDERLADAEIFVPEFVVGELEQQANDGREIGHVGLSELKELREQTDRYDIKVTYVGRRASGEEIERAKEGSIDALIRDVAEEHDATLYTADYVQHKVADAKGLAVRYFPKDDDVEFSLRDYFEDDIASVHLKQGDVPKAKRGEPGSLEYVPIGETALDKGDLEQLMKEAIEKAETSERGLVEMDMDGATVLQIGDLRIAMTQPPFSEAREITAVRPIAKVGLDDYEMTDKLTTRLEEHAEGILIAGSPGHGKSTFAQALAEFYDDAGKVVKTMEHPRDLQVGPGITQYSPLEEDMENTGDLLLLVRPDYTVYDEVRKTHDFDVFADMRLAGVGMIGVVHASEALDAVQRMIGRVDLGVIPQVVDTVVFIENMQIQKVYKLRLTVKVPQGMMEEDLARPVIEIVDFESEEPEYEIYTYGEETVVIPVQESDSFTSGLKELAKNQLTYRLENHVSNPEVEFTSENHVNVYVDENQIGQLIGHQGKTIDRLEDELGVGITVEPRSEKPSSVGGGGSSSRRGGGSEEVNFHLEDQGDAVVVMFDDNHQGDDIEFYTDGDFLFAATVGKGGKIRLKKSSDFANTLLDAHASGDLTARK